MKVVFILGSGHCGSTLLDMLFHSHPCVIGLGEMESLHPQAVCACGKVAYSCGLWSNVLSEIDTIAKIYRKKKDFVLNNHRFFYKREAGWQIANENSQKQLIVENHNIFSIIKDHLGVSALTDSSKNIDRAEFLSNELEMKPILIHIVRDPRAVVWSYKKKYNKLLPFVWKWLMYNIKMEFLKRRTKHDSIFITYEKLVSEPEVTMNVLFKKLKLPIKTKSNNFKKMEHHQIGGNRMRYNFTDGITEDTDWKRRMPYFDRCIVLLVCGWLGVYYGYFK